MTRSISGSDSFAERMAQHPRSHAASREDEARNDEARGDRIGPPPATASASVSSQRVRTRFVLVATDVGERPGLVLEWAKINLVWTARVAFVVDDNATMVVEWLPADVLTPVSGQA